MVLVGGAVFCAPLASQENLLAVAVLQPNGNGLVTEINKKTVQSAAEEFLTNSKHYKVVDRAKIDQILREQRFQRASGLVNQQTIKNLGNVLGADIICDIDLHMESDYLNVSCRLINVTTAEGETASDTFEYKKDDPILVRDQVEIILMRMLKIESPRQIQARERQKREEEELRDKLARERKEQEEAEERRWARERTSIAEAEAIKARERALQEIQENAKKPGMFKSMLSSMTSTFGGSNDAAPAPPARDTQGLSGKELQAQIEKRANEIAEAMLKTEAEKKAREAEAERAARAEVEKRANEIAEAMLKAEADRKAREAEAERVVRAEVEKRVSEIAEAMLKAEAERTARAEAEKKAREIQSLSGKELQAEIEKRANEIAEARLKAEAEMTATTEEEGNARETQSLSGKELQAEIEKRANEIAEARLKAEAEMTATTEDEGNAREAQSLSGKELQAEIEKRANEIAEARLKAEAERKAREAEAGRAAMTEGERKARDAEAEEDERNAKQAEAARVALAEAVEKAREAEAAKAARLEAEKEREAREEAERTARAEAEKEREAREEAERTARAEAERTVRVHAGLDRPTIANTAPAEAVLSVSTLALTKDYINTLMPNFSFEKKKNEVTCLSRALNVSLKQQRQMLFDRKTDFWHSLFIEIRQGELFASSQYEYINKKNSLSHTRLTVTIDGKTASTDMALDTRTVNVLKTTIEEARIMDEEILRFIANNLDSQIQVRIENTSGGYKEYIMNSVVKYAIAQTLDLYDAMTVLKAHGAEIKQSY
jgi:hypothetical protein